MAPITHTPVKGLPQLNAALGRCGRFMDKELQTRLKGYARPVQADASTLAVVQIPRMTVRWSQMRVGANAKMVYVAPVQRGTRIVPRKLPKFARKLLAEAMIPALEHNRVEIERNIDALVGRMEREYARG
jgi:hypothetical protein